jgi:hypothetical protein
MNNKLHFSSARTGVKQQDKWETPAAVFEQLNEGFNFTLYPDGFMVKNFLSIIEQQKVWQIVKHSKLLIEQKT